MYYKYSILIPTFNRRKYLEKTLETILDQNYADYELIVSDSGSSDDTWEYLKKLDYPNLKIIKPEKKLSEVENFEFIINQAKGEWIVLIGDDDGVLPEFFKNIDDIIKKHPDVEAISSKSGYYYHENVQDLYGNRVISFNYLSRKISKVNSKKSLFFCLLGIYTRADVPMLYTSGVIKKSLVDKIKKKSQNKFFHSIIEDYYSMVAILNETKSYVRCEKPLFWIGTSKSSSGRGLRIYENNENVEDFLKLSGNVSETLHKVGISSIYFLEAIYKNPYITSFWKSKIISLLAYVCAFNDIQNRNDTNRFKINLKRDEILKEIMNEIKKNNHSLILFYLLNLSFKIVNNLIKIFNFFVKTLNFLKKKLFKKSFFDINSSDRGKYPSLPACNKIIDKILKK